MATQKNTIRSVRPQPNEAKQSRAEVNREWGREKRSAEKKEMSIIRMLSFLVPSLRFHSSWSSYASFCTKTSADLFIHSLCSFVFGSNRESFKKKWNKNTKTQQQQQQQQNNDNKFEIGARYLNDNLHITLKLMPKFCCEIFHFRVFTNRLGRLRTRTEQTRKERKKTRNNQHKSKKSSNQSRECNIHHKNV